MLLKNNRKVIFVTPPLSADKRYGKLWHAGGSEPPLGLCYLSSAVKKQGFKVHIVDAQACNLCLEDTVSLIMSLGPKYVGITASTMAIESAAKLAEAIKILNSEIKIIIGGCHVTALPIETLQQYRFFDIGVVGEGEDTIREMLLALENNIELRTVNGLVIREGGKICLTPSRSRIKNLDDLPYPAFDLLPEINKFYRLPSQSLGSRYSFSLVTSRGCFGKCAFCDKKVFDNYVSLHSAEYIIELVNILSKNYKINTIMFEDDNFMVSKKRLACFVNLINKNKLKIAWTSLARIDSIDEESLKMAKDGGCWQISYGIESGCQRILDFYKKNITIGKIREVIGLTRKAGLKIKGFFMWGNPIEDKDSIKETVSFIKSLDIDDIAISFFTPYPGAELWADIESYGNLERKWQKMSCYELVFKPHNLDEEYLVSSRKQILRDFYFRPRIIFSYLTRIKSLMQLKEFFLSAYYLFCYTFNDKKNR